MIVRSTEAKKYTLGLFICEVSNMMLEVGEAHSVRRIVHCKVAQMRITFQSRDATTGEPSLKFFKSIRDHHILPSILCSDMGLSEEMILRLA